MKHTFKIKTAYYRQLKSLTQRQLAKKLGVDHSTITKWERGTNFISKSNLARCARFFAVKIDELIEIVNCYS